MAEATLVPPLRMSADSAWRRSYQMIRRSLSPVKCRFKQVRPGAPSSFTAGVRSIGEDRPHALGCRYPRRPVPFRPLLTLTVSAALLLGVAMPAAAAGYPPGFSEEVLASGLTRPMEVAWAPDGRMFVIQKDGLLRVVLPGSREALVDQGLLGARQRSARSRAPGAGSRQGLRRQPVHLPPVHVRHRSPRPRGSGVGGRDGLPATQGQGQWAQRALRRDTDPRHRDRGDLPRSRQHRGLHPLRRPHALDRDGPRRPEGRDAVGRQRRRLHREHDLPGPGLRR